MAAQMSHSISIFSLYQVLSRLSILILIVLLQARLRRTPHGVAHDASIMRVGICCAVCLAYAAGFVPRVPRRIRIVHVVCFGSLLCLAGVLCVPHQHHYARGASL